MLIVVLNAETHKDDKETKMMKKETINATVTSKPSAASPENEAETFALKRKSLHRYAESEEAYKMVRRLPSHTPYFLVLISISMFSLKRCCA